MIFGLLGAAAAAAQADLPPCQERAGFRDPPWVNGLIYCLEDVIRDPDAGDLAFTALAAAPDGTLYAARPLRGEVLALTDSDGDGLPDQSQVVISGLTLPNGLAYHAGALYIAHGPYLDRWADGQRVTLVADLPVAPGGWAGGVVVGPDARLYVSVGAGCDFCVPESDAAGAVLSFALDGSDRRVIATGLRQAAGLAFLGDQLWVTDSARLGLADTPDLDELNRVTAGAHFGWPFCIGAARLPDPLAEPFDCALTTAPDLTFSTGSTPLGLAAYTGAALPDLDGTLLVALNGSRHRVDLRGYALAAVRFDAAGNPARYDILIPMQLASPSRDRFNPVEMSYRGSGFWPHRPLAVAVSPEGWVYLSVSGGQILALRPQTR
jgi:glucose/arabinose dehydrogenase